MVLVEETGQIPKGNLQGETLWKPKRSPASKSEIRLTPGKGIDDLTVPIIDLIAQVIISCKVKHAYVTLLCTKHLQVVVFIKGTRTEPQCGFSQQMLTILNQNRVDYEVVNVLDEIHNPGVRESIKEFSQWPTIPQVRLSYGTHFDERKCSVVCEWTICGRYGYCYGNARKGRASKIIAKRLMAKYVL